MSTPEHGGTHIDAPIHFAEQGWLLGEVPVDRLVAPGVVINASAAAERDPDYRLTAEDVLDWERSHGEVPAGAIVLLRTGWSSRWPDARAYLGDDTPGDASNLHFPAYGAEAARLLDRADAASRPWASTPPASTTGLRPISSCTGLPPPPTSSDFENLTNLDQAAVHVGDVGCRASHEHCRRLRGTGQSCGAAQMRACAAAVPGG